MGVGLVYLFVRKVTAVQEPPARFPSGLLVSPPQQECDPVISGDKPAGVSNRKVYRYSTKLKFNLPLGPASMLMGTEEQRPSSPMIPASSLISATRTYWMPIVVSLLVLLSALYVILAKDHYADAHQKWAFGIIGTILGYWLKR